ncbi:STAS/SEC14 domain-containing protein [Arthrobacter sp. Br18]|uniref:DUF7793 family protein n=1 Tax=Arthrobacter sp. Br18 TaxID=1312954 RepID=UPI0004B74C93|nr:STAS/SEC14 domain-containing protein [Arthrobacter sp. Br18]
MREEPPGEADASSDLDARGQHTDPDATADSNGITIMTLSAGERITEAIAEAKAAEARELAGTVARPLLIDISGVLSIDREARAVLGRASVSTAIALLGSSPVDRVIGSFLLGGQPPSCPVEFFSSRSEALEWLAGYRRYPESDER